jgi:hypothetical protein
MLPDPLPDVSPNLLWFCFLTRLRGNVYRACADKDFRYADQSAYDAHSKTADFQNLVKVFKDEELLSGPLVIKYLKPIGGFESKL